MTDHTNTVFIPFRPALDGPFAHRFLDKVRCLSERRANPTDLLTVADAEAEWAATGTSVNPRQRRIYRAIWLFLRDLIQVGWSYRWNDGVFEIGPPSTGHVEGVEAVWRAKDAIRRSMGTRRLERLQEASEFVARMERPPAGAIAQRSILDLIADGPALAVDLLAVRDLADPTGRAARLADVMQPYLQLVEENERCAQTGHKLGDIWRYFRFTWTTPAETTPGRTLLYLVRDAARPLHPVVGIASLENAPVGVTDRDDHLGWTPSAFIRDLEAAQDEAALRHEYQRLLSYIDRALEDIDLTGLCTPEQCRAPSEALISKLAGISARTVAEREHLLRSWHTERDDDDADDRPIDRVEADALLFRRKRADHLGRLLTARRALLSLIERSDFAEVANRFVQTESGRSVVRIALQALKNRHIGTSLLELNVCGAVPPDNHLLGGNLVALLILSPQVICDYRARYGTRPSTIATGIKGEDVIRPAELLYLGTSSLYHAGSSQYNRLSLPVGSVGAGSTEVRWRQIGQTVGYGTLQFSRRTMMALEEATNVTASRAGGAATESVYVTHTFGEGASPKLRTVRKAMGVLFEPNQQASTDGFMKHAMGRLVYGAWLAQNGPAILRGSDEQPQYYFGEVEPSEGTALIADYWRQRWLASRLNYEPALDRVAALDVDTVAVSRDLIDDQPLAWVPIREIVAMPNSTTNQADSWREFVRGLYRGTSAYADSMRVDHLKGLHVATKLDDEIVRHVAEGRSVILTGNPGDGKTHLLRIVEGRLLALPNQPVVELDASAVPDQELHRRWVAAGDRPFCVAINEAVLMSLAEQFPDFAPIQSAKRQVESAVAYAEGDLPLDGVVVFDLSLRNALAPRVVGPGLDQLIDETRLQRCGRCPAEGCDMVRNQRLLRSPLFRERLQAIFDRVMRRGNHATLRELQAFASYLIFGDRSCEELIRASGEWTAEGLPQLVFSGTGGLFDAVAEAFDPARVSHPVLDDRLVFDPPTASEWADGWLAEVDALDPENGERFAARKRAHYFFHPGGADLLAMADDDEAAFARFLDAVESSNRKALREILRGINDFFRSAEGSDTLRVWQSHRYNQSPRRVLYSVESRPRSDFVLALPRLIGPMQEAYDLHQDHAMLQSRSSHEAALRVDFGVFSLLLQARRGLPVLALQTDETRRLWQFMDRLARPINETSDEVDVFLLDVGSGDRAMIKVDLAEPQYLALCISRAGVDDAG